MPLHYREESAIANEGLTVPGGYYNMITTVMRSVVENASALQTRDHFLYLVGDEEGVLYRGRS